jgi:hypothetical protein
LKRLAGGSVATRLARTACGTEYKETGEAPMNIGGNQTATKRRSKDQAKIRSTKPKVPKAEWKLADDELDDALRQTFPASDALSLVQSARCS